MKALLGGLFVLLLAACTTAPHTLVREDDTPFVTGVLIHDKGANNSLVLQTDKHRYEARGFEVERQTDLVALRERYFIADRNHWDRILDGIDNEHTVFSVETTASSADGSKMTCHLIWRSSTQPSGVCTDQAGTAFSVRFR